MSDPRVTYYLGAGASAQAIPMVSQIRRFYKPFLSFIESKIGSMGWGDVNIQVVNETYEQFKSITEELEKHHSPDTFAKKLWLTKQYLNSKRLKIYLSLFFHWVETRYVPLDNEELKGGVDERYDPFLATLLERSSDDNLRLPKYVNIVTWNYDNQFEIAYSRYLDRISDEAIRNGMCVIPRASNQDNSLDLSKLIKLNGCSRLFFNNKKEVQSPFKDPSDEEMIKFWMHEFSNSPGHDISNVPLINFAWETDNLASQESLKEAKEIFSKTQILVIIGYSFPTFNRKVDKDLFKSLSPECTVYYQAPEPVVKDLIGKLKSIRSLMLVEQVINLDQFHIPIEL